MCDWFYVLAVFSIKKYFCILIRLLILLAIDFYFQNGENNSLCFFVSFVLAHKHKMVYTLEFTRLPKIFLSKPNTKTVTLLPL